MLTIEDLNRIINIPSISLDINQGRVKDVIDFRDEAIPFVDNLPLEAVERFQNQVELISMIDNEDVGAITAKVKECIEKDPGAIEEEAMVIDVSEGGEAEEDEGEAVRVVSGETALLEARIRDIDTEIKMIGAIQKNMTGNYAGKVQGIMIGLLFMIVIMGLFLFF